MTIERTLALIKPDAVAARNRDAIINRIKENGFTIIAEANMTLSLKEAQAFYQEHIGKSFFDELVNFISSGSLTALVLEKEAAITSWRSLMGATNFKEAAKGTIRADFATSINNNAVHGSDSEQSAQREICFFFRGLELI